MKNIKKRKFIDKNFYLVLIIIVLLVGLGISGKFLFKNSTGVANYVFFGKLSITGQTSSTYCSQAGGTCKAQCNTDDGEYEINESCDEIPQWNKDGGIPPTPITGASFTGKTTSGDFKCCYPGYCGDEIIGFNEECDNGNNNGVLCDNSTSNCVYCSDDCKNITRPGPPFCGDGRCDDLDNYKETCSSCPEDCNGTTGPPACTSPNEICKVNKFGEGKCENLAELPCGNGIIEGEELGGSEVCDGNNLSGKTCADFGFKTGTLKCSADCRSFDKSGCSNDTTPPDDNNDHGGPSPPATPPTCTEVNGTCSTECAPGYVYYGNKETDESCFKSHGIKLICCVINGTSESQLQKNSDSSNNNVGNGSSNNQNQENTSNSKKENVSDYYWGFFGGNKENPEEINLHNLFSSNNYLLVKILSGIAIAFALFFLLRKFHLAFWEKLTNKTLFPSKEKKIIIKKSNFTNNFR